MIIVVLVTDGSIVTPLLLILLILVFVFGRNEGVLGDCNVLIKMGGGHQ